MGGSPAIVDRMNTHRVSVRLEVCPGMEPNEDGTPTRGLARRWGRDSDGQPKFIVNVRPGLGRREHAEVLIHELLHVAFWDMDEDAINRVGRDMARILDRMGMLK